MKKQAKKPTTFKAFLTGSRAYGKPRADSDVDLVVFVSEGHCPAIVAPPTFALHSAL